MWAAVINIIIGLFVMVSPGIFGFEKPVADIFHIAGPLVVTFSITALWEVNRSARYLNIPVGLWFAISPFIYNFKVAEATWIGVISGLLIVVLSLVKGKVTGRYGGCWRSLFQKDPVHAR